MRGQRGGHRRGGVSRQQARTHPRRNALGIEQVDERRWQRARPQRLNPLGNPLGQPLRLLQWNQVRSARHRVDLGMHVVRRIERMLGILTQIAVFGTGDAPSLEIGVAKDFSTVTTGYYGVLRSPRTEA